MIKHLWILLFSLLLLTNFACSFSSDEREEDSATVAEAPSEDGEIIEEVEEISDDGDDEYEIVDGEEVAEVDVSGEGEDGIVADLGDEEELPEDIAGDDSSEEIIADEVEPVEETSFDTPEEDVPVADTSFDDSVTEEPTFEDEAPAPAKKAFIPVKKIKDVPFNRAGQNLNTVYIVRPGDTLDSVSQKIFGGDRTSDLIEANPHLNRSFKVGDKVYYNSPQRPDDDSQIMNFYEDQGVSPETYVSQPGENIREVSESLLGHPRSWMEVWATNDVESKWALPAGTELRYWPNNIAVGGPGDTMAEAPPEPEEADIPPPPEPVAVNDPPPPPPPAPEPIETPPPPPPVEVAQNDVGSAGTIEPPPPPPPPAPEPVIEEAAPPPPPPPPPRPKKARKKRPEPKKEGSMLDSVLGGEDGTFNLLLIAGVLLIGMAGALIIIRKRRASKRINLGETQV